MHAKISLFVPVVKGMAIEKWVNVTSGDRDALKVALAKHGPISVGIDAAHKSLSFYSNGVYYEPKCGNTTDALVRYTYPKVRNRKASNIRKIRLSKNTFFHLFAQAKRSVNQLRSDVINALPCVSCGQKQIG